MKRVLKRRLSRGILDDRGDKAVEWRLEYHYPFSNQLLWEIGIGSTLVALGMVGFRRRVRCEYYD